MLNTGTGSIIGSSPFHYVVIDYVAAAQAEYRVLYMRFFYLRSCTKKMSSMIF